MAATAALEEVRDSKKFAELLELILMMGNFMNTGSRNAQSIGFELSFLTKVSCLGNRLQILMQCSVIRYHFQDILSKQPPEMP